MVGSGAGACGSKSLTEFSSVLSVKQEAATSESEDGEGGVQELRKKEKK